MPATIDQLDTFVPVYLRPEQRKVLLEEIKAFPRIRAFYGARVDNSILQGDGWTGAQVVDIETGERRRTRVISLSNSCDIDEANPRDTPSRITFAPIVKLASYEERLRAAKIGEQAISEKLAAIRSQKVSELFYLPPGQALQFEYIGVLSEAFSMPMQYYVRESERRHLFTLSLSAFYLFVLKLSIHFCRMHEGVERSVNP